MNTNEHEYYFWSDKLFGRHLLAPIRDYSCSFVAKILSMAGQRPQTTKSVSAGKAKTHIGFGSSLPRLPRVVAKAPPRPPVKCPIINQCVKIQVHFSSTVSAYDQQ